MNKPVLGIVGGIGSGKSFVAAELVAQGAYLIDADRLGYSDVRDARPFDSQVEVWRSAGQYVSKWNGVIVATTPQIAHCVESCRYRA